MTYRPQRLSMSSSGAAGTTGDKDCDRQQRDTGTYSHLFSLSEAAAAEDGCRGLVSAEDCLQPGVPALCPTTCNSTIPATVNATAGNGKRARSPLMRCLLGCVS